MKLTDLKVKYLKPEEKSYKVRDGKGLYLFVLKTGGKSWRYDYKIKIDIDKYKNGTYVYGRYPEMSLAEAREEHMEIRKLTARNICPNTHKKQQERIAFQNRPMTFAEMAQDWLDKRRLEIKEKTVQDIEKRLDKDVFPEIGDIALESLNPLDVLYMLKKIEKRGAYELAARARQYVSGILKYAVAHGKIERDVSADLGEALAVRKVNHQPALAPHEIPEFLEALERNEARLFHPTRLALKMLMLTFVRPIELASAEWKDFDFEGKRWIIPADKMKMGNDHIVPLASQTLAILNEMRVLNGSRQHVFVKQTDPRQHMSRDTLSAAIRSMGFQGRHSAHGFRALARTAIREKLKWDSEIIERQLAHAPSGSLGRAYDRTQFLDDRIIMMQEWADYVDACAKGNVIEGNFSQSA